MQRWQCIPCHGSWRLESWKPTREASLIIRPHLLLCCLSTSTVPHNVVNITNHLHPGPRCRSPNSVAWVPKNESLQSSMALEELLCELQWLQGLLEGSIFYTSEAFPTPSKLPDCTGSGSDRAYPVGCNLDNALHPIHVRTAWKMHGNATT